MRTSLISADEGLAADAAVAMVRTACEKRGVDCNKIETLIPTSAVQSPCHAQPYKLLLLTHQHRHASLLRRAEQSGRCRPQHRSYTPDRALAMGGTGTSRTAVRKRGLGADLQAGVDV